MSAAFERALLDAAAAPYRSAGRFAWHFARGKLARDPVFVALLERGVLPDARRLLDLGCGQGLLAAWLRAARTLHDAGQWRSDWPAPPRIGRYRGVELMPRDVQRARVALGATGDFEQGDLRSADFGETDVIVVLDVLHFLDYPAQLDVLRRARAALPPGGLLVTRIGDADGGLRFLMSRCVDSTVSFFRGHRRPRGYCRSTADWTATLRDLGFRVDAQRMSAGTPFANVMLAATASEAGARRDGGRATVC
ncbi:MAG: class I SAM-dependent methyltransferase [Casimicrobiaceae bacterium]